MAKGSEMFQGLPSWAKGVIAVGVLGGIAIVGYVIYKKINDATEEGKEEKKTKDVLDENDKEIKELEKKGIRRSATLSSLGATANIVENLLSGAETPASEYKAALMVAQSVRNPLDWAYLVKAFGSRDIPDAFSVGLAKTKYSLGDLLKEQLDSRLVTPSTFQVGKFSKKYWGSDTWADALTDYLQSVGVKL
jgi:hypothetical protein